MSANDHQWVNSPYKKWYKRWVIYHVATYSLAGAILFPLSHVRRDCADTPVSICAKTIACSAGGMVAGASIGLLLGIPGPLSYVIMGGYWLKNN